MKKQTQVEPLKPIPPPTNSDFGEYYNRLGYVLADAKANKGKKGIIEFDFNWDEPAGQANSMNTVIQNNRVAMILESYKMAVVKIKSALPPGRFDQEATLTTFGRRTPQNINNAKSKTEINSATTGF